MLAPLVPAPKPGGRPARHERREIVDAILDVRRTGGPWRALPHDLPPGGPVWWWFRCWRRDGTWEAITAALREQVRTRRGRQPTPSAAIRDRQSTKTTEQGGLGGTTPASRGAGASASSSSTPRGSW